MANPYNHFDYDAKIDLERAEKKDGKIDFSLIKYIYVSLYFNRIIMDCPKCNCQKNVKAGFIGKKQRYRCKECGYYFTVKKKSTAKTVHIKKLALYLYLEGLTYRKIGKILGVSSVSVMKWMNKYGEDIKKIHTDATKPILKDTPGTIQLIKERERYDSKGLLIIDLSKKERETCLCKTFCANFGTMKGFNIIDI